MKSYKSTLWANMPEKRLPRDPNRRSKTAKDLHITDIIVASWKGRKKQAGSIRNNPEAETLALITLFQITTTKTTKTILEQKESQKLFTHRVPSGKKPTHTE